MPVFVFTRSKNISRRTETVPRRINTARDDVGPTYGGQELPEERLTLHGYIHDRDRHNFSLPQDIFVTQDI